MLRSRSRFGGVSRRGAHAGEDLSRSGSSDRPGADGRGRRWRRRDRESALAVETWLPSTLRCWATAWSMPRRRNSERLRRRGLGQGDATWSLPACGLTLLFAATAKRSAPQRRDDLADGGVAGRADRRHAAEAVQHPVEALQHDRHVRLPQRVGIGLAFVAQGIEAGGDDQRRREAGEVFRDAADFAPGPAAARPSRCTEGGTTRCRRGR